MRSVFDIQQLLKKFGTFIYVGDRLLDLELMETEIQDLFQSKLINQEQYMMALLLLRKEMTKEKEAKTKA